MYIIDIVPWQPQKHADTLPKFDNVKLTAIATCPTFGIMRYDHHKVYASGKRAMALEAGLAAHEAFAATRLGDLYWNGADFYEQGEAWCRNKAVRRSIQLHGEKRTESWLAQMNKGEDIERSIMLGALDMFESTGYYDDPDDKRRTIANIEETIIAYVSRYPLGKIMCVVTTDAMGREFIGVEMPVDTHLRIEDQTRQQNVHEYHFVGRVDGVMWHDRSKRRIDIEDDKTAARLNDAWHESWKINHQPTGYCAAISAILDTDIRTGTIRGASIPLPKTYDYGGIVSAPFTRTDQQFDEWADYVIHVMGILEQFGPRPLHAPRYTHSCNRYFRPCNYIMFCDSPTEERAAMYNEMDDEVWNPLDGAHYEEDDGQ
jgi:hypothetical protein